MNVVHADAILARTVKATKKVVVNCMMVGVGLILFASGVLKKSVCRYEMRRSY